METRTLIRPAAEVVTVVALRQGDVYKRLQTASYGDDDKLIYGVVTDVGHNGTEAYVSAVEFKLAHAGAEVVRKVFSGGRDIAVFPVSTAEVASHFADARKAANDAVESAERDLEKKRAVLAELEEVIAGQDVLTAAETTAIEVSA